MTRTFAALAVALAATLALSGCATTQRLAAAGDVHALLIAIRDDDRQTFEEHIDRRALQAQLRSRIVEHASRARIDEGWKALAIALAAPLARAGSDLFVQPEVFREVAGYYGYRPGTPIPNSLYVAAALKALPDGRVCAARKRHGDCLLTFADEGGTWRLVSFDGEADMLRKLP